MRADKEENKKKSKSIGDGVVVYKLNWSIYRSPPVMQRK